jgi:hypothetical protein
MSLLNPYASFLGDHDAVSTITATPDKLAILLEALGATGANRQPAPGKWSGREIMCHLADCELVFAFRLRQTLAQDNHVVQPFDQDQWAKGYAMTYDAESALKVFSTVRQWNLKLIKSLPPEAFSKRLTHPERGEMSFHVLVETMGGHDINHLRQLESIAAKSAGEAGLL